MTAWQPLAKTPFWAERIELNPTNRERVMAMDPHEFARVCAVGGRRCDRISTRLSESPRMSCGQLKFHPEVPESKPFRAYEMVPALI